MNAIQYNNLDNQIEFKDNHTLTLSDRDRDIFLAELESPSLPNAALKALMSK